MDDRSQQYRIVIEGWCDPLFLASILEDVKKVTSADGGFTLSVGSMADEHVSEAATRASASDSPGISLDD